MGRFLAALFGNQDFEKKKVGKIKKKKKHAFIFPGGSGHGMCSDSAGTGSTPLGSFSVSPQSAHVPICPGSSCPPKNSGGQPLTVPGYWLHILESTILRKK